MLATARTLTSPRRRLTPPPLAPPPAKLETYGHPLKGRHAWHAVDPTAQVIVGGTFFHEQLIPGTISYTAEMLQA